MYGTRHKYCHYYGNNSRNHQRCPDEREARSDCLFPMYWLIITAPPDESAVNKKINTVLNDVTNETPETSASLEKLTTNVSAMPETVL